MGTLGIKRIYAPPDRGDGVRILVDRLWPRGVSRSAASIDRWLKEIAPSPALRKWFNHDPARFSEFRDRYRGELDGNPEPAAEIADLVKDHDVTLVYAARSESINHARVLAEYLGQHGCPLKGEGRDGRDN